ncbi:sporulation protein YqfD [Bacillus sp. FJAT-27225]|uniref:sporulation protein YqfD n=1 Tax=Bacillus sp. FJAT-27225 TaxID=1743144 RepID=UPI00080C2475|nr:sporulation protein YqfD [Bacillus sp. FJAT-27225]OCA91151.1 sporulation protein YqfD [Bacillus sp. FJAT-27225]
MKNAWAEFLTGKVTVKLTGKGLERFLNTLTRSGVLMWNVKRLGPETMMFTISLQDALKIHTLSRGRECKVTFIRRKGVPFLFKRLLKNSGFLIGGFVFFFMVMLLSNMVWGIEIKGAQPETEHIIRKELDKMGIKIGKPQFTLDNVEAIQRKLTDRVGAITWVGVELHGTTYQLRVVEKNEPKEPEYVSPRHLVAKKEAIIVNYFIEKGQRLFEVNDHVVPGQLLVSGLYGKEGEQEPVASSGEIWGETLYKAYVELPLNATFKVYNGEEKEKHSLQLGKVKVPIWGFGKPEFSEYEKETTAVPVKFLKWEMPISYVNTTYRESEIVKREYSKDEAMNNALDSAEKEIKKRIDEDAIIKGEKILHQSIANGKVRLSILYTVVENIAIGQPIIRGD